MKPSSRLRLGPEQQAAIAAAPPPPTLASLGLAGAKASKPRRSMLGTLGGPGPWRIVIPGWHPTLLNRLVGAPRGQAAGRKQKDAEALLGAMVGKVPEAMGKRRVRLTLVYPKGKQWPDRDNVWKSLLDGLVKIGALVDDSGEWLDSAEPMFETGAKATILELEDC